MRACLRQPKGPKHRTPHGSDGGVAQNISHVKGTDPREKEKEKEKERERERERDRERAVAAAAKLQLQQAGIKYELASVGISLWEQLALRMPCYGSIVVVCRPARWTGQQLKHS